MDKDISKKSASDKGSERANGRAPGGEYESLPFGPETEMLALHSAIGNQAVGRLLQSSGQPLDPAERNFMESRFGHDFGQVRTHSDAREDESARALKAKAYTIANDIIFRAGQYITETKEGRKLLAHELAHTIQQGNSTCGLQTKLEITHPGNTAEREAEDAAIKI